MRWIESSVLKKYLVALVCFFIAGVLLLLLIETENKDEKASPVIGNLGGVPVSIPREFARFVQYEKSPPSLDQENKATIKRTTDSFLESFALKAYFAVGSNELHLISAGSKSDDSYNNDDILRVVVLSGKSYGSAGIKNLSHRLQSYLEGSRNNYTYSELSQSVFGLTGYSPIDSSDRLAIAESIRVIRERKLYVDKNEEGVVTTFIECSNSRVLVATCRHSFNLDPYMRARVTVIYRLGLLEKWNEIQLKVLDLLKSFSS